MFEAGDVPVPQLQVKRGQRLATARRSPPQSGRAGAWPARQTIRLRRACPADHRFTPPCGEPRAVRRGSPSMILHLELGVDDVVVAAAPLAGLGARPLR